VSPVVGIMGDASRGAASVATPVVAVPSVDAAPESQEVAWRHRHLLDVDTLSGAELELVMRTTDAMREVLARPIAKVPALRGRQVTILFYEASTRTRVSFEVAAKNLSADVINIAAASSSVSKGESLVDTVRTVEALGAQMLVVRHPVSGAPYLAAEIFGGSVLNGGDGWHAHPTQALLDLYTMRERLGSAAVGAGSQPAGTVAGLLAGRKVAIVGDVLHSRVAHSNIWTLTAAGADLWLCGPPTLIRGFERWAGRNRIAGRGFHVTTSIDEALRDADVVMALRLQRERMAAGLFPSLREYAARYGLTRERLALARPGALVMHPGPMNEGVEIAPDVAAGAQSVITDQVTNGVAVRMAVLYLLAGTQAAA
jgi:aspartate carbamoyltransferase catalytic subunit